MKRPEISAWAVAGACVLFYIDPGGIFFPFLLSCAVHEAAHLFCAFFLRLPIERIQLTLLGARIRVRQGSRAAMFICTAAGPFASLALGVAFLCFAPKIALLSLTLGLFNMLPFQALDGGQMLLLLLDEGKLRWIQLAFFLLFGVLALTMTALGFGLWPVFLFSALLLRAGVETAVAIRFQNR